jgi:outer membrane protein
MLPDKMTVTAASLTPDHQSHANKCIHNRVSLWFIVGCLMTLLVSNMAMAQTDKPVRGDTNRVQAKGFLYGVTLIHSDAIYKGVDSRVLFWPLIGYRGQQLTIFGPFVSYTLTKTESLELSVLLKPRFDGFEDSDSAIFQGMAMRSPSIDIGLGLNYQRNAWKFKVSGTRDLLDRSNGSELITKVSRTFRIGPLSIEPNIGLTYLDTNHVDYYYGVRPLEATVERPQYLGSSALSNTFGINFATPIFFGGFSRLGIEHTWFDTSITNSPLTDVDTSLMFIYSFTRFF